MRRFYFWCSDFPTEVPPSKGPLDSGFLDYPLSMGTQAVPHYTVIHWCLDVHHSGCQSALISHPGTPIHPARVISTVLWGVWCPSDHWLAHLPQSIHLHCICHPLWSLTHPIIWVSFLHCLLSPFQILVTSLLPKSSHQNLMGNLNLFFSFSHLFLPQLKLQSSRPLSTI